MKVLSKELSDLALPPTIEEVIEDRYDEKENFDFDFVIAILRGIADALYYLHTVCHVSHGDVYAHNIVVNKQNKNLNSVYLLDLGAASYYGDDKGSALLNLGLCEKVEVRAFGILANELLNRIDNINIVDQKNVIILKDLVYICTGNIVKRRPLFVTILKILNDI
jgi:serine/threonine protein kinase